MLLSLFLSAVILRIGLRSDAYLAFRIIQGTQLFRPFLTCTTATYIVLEMVFVNWDLWNTDQATAKYLDGDRFS